MRLCASSKCCFIGIKPETQDTTDKGVSQGSSNGCAKPTSTHRAISNKTTSVFVDANKYAGASKDISAIWYSVCLRVLTFLYLQILKWKRIARAARSIVSIYRVTRQESWSHQSPDFNCRRVRRITASIIHRSDFSRWHGYRFRSDSWLNWLVSSFESLYGN